MRTKVARRSFAGGEITPEMFGRLDNIKNQTGLALCRNALVTPHGPVTKRPGMAFVNVARVSASAVRTIPFVYSTTQSIVLEFGAGYVRFHTQGATLLEANVAISSIVGSTVNTSAPHGYTVNDDVVIGGRTLRIGTIVSTTPVGTTAARIYTVASPYAAADLFLIKFTQDSDVLTLTCPGYAPRELRRLGATNWQLTQPSLGAAVISAETRTRCIGRHGYHFHQATVATATPGTCMPTNTRPKSAP